MRKSTDTRGMATGAIEQAITSHPLVAEASVVGIPDALKGQLPFAFVTLSEEVVDAAASASASASAPAVPDPHQLAEEIGRRVREQIGGIAALGGVIQGGRGLIPKTRSGKTLRRVLRELVENAVHGDFDRPVPFPATIEDPAAVDVARRKVAEYFATAKGASAHRPIEARAKL
ncbi:hypothetical protein SLS62_007160 [Diatrype stigma]|uniref:AMP-binding enzyme C-terminal domain-containing protein n=1 Tax=Diatrype stigma TaxID=117547 RepID=A0AAN9UQ77_9PEZI